MISIIIPVHNEKDLLERCIKSVQQKTHIDYELIVVDDCSNKETSNFCLSLRRQEIITCYLRNDKRHGFSYTCNRGLKAIESDYYCLLNSDTEIGTDNWLQKVIDVGERDSKIGILGVLSNNATSQSILSECDLPAGYSVEQFSQLVKKLTEHKNPETILVNGFCYFLKHEVLKEIGFLDEKRYPHYGSEDDFTFKAGLKGFKSVIVDSVFVYHKSNASYKEEQRKIITSKTIPQFYEDWGYDKILNATRQSYDVVKYLRNKIACFLQSGKTLKTVDKLDLSICMIVKNEEKNLRRCLSSIKDIASEIIVVDTGSVDSTILIAQEFGSKIFHYEWCDDFSKARNFSISKATRKWIFIIDADEIVEEKDLCKFPTLLESNLAYDFITRNYVNDLNIEGIVFDDSFKGFIGWCPSTKIRLFKNKGLRFNGEVHEMIDVKKSQVNNSNITIHHFGEISNKKKQYYLKLNKKKQSNNKTTAELAEQYLSIGNYDEALVLFRKLNDFAKMGTTFNLLKNYKQAEKYFLLAEKSEYVYKHLGICYALQQKYLKAYKSFKNIIDECNDLKTFGDYAFCCIRLEKYEEAIRILKRASKINTKIVKSWGMLKEAQFYLNKSVSMKLD